MQQKRNQQAEIRLGSHGEDYGSWMSNPVFYIILFVLFQQFTMSFIKK